jgi:hypothetical protein
MVTDEQPVKLKVGGTEIGAMSDDVDAAAKVVLTQDAVELDVSSSLILFAFKSCTS